jgi:hypothetical protein
MTPTPLIALVSTGRRAAKEADPFYVSIRQKAIAFRAIGQPNDQRIYVAILLKLFDDLLRPEVIRRSVGVAVVTEVN